MPRTSGPTADATTSELLQPCEHRAWRSELTSDLVDELVAAGMCGALKADAALSCGVPPDLFEAWLDEGLRSDAPALLRELSVRFLCSRKKLAVALSERLVQAALNGDNKLALELLERQNPHWGKDPERKERENVQPEMGLDTRRRILVESFRNPRGEMRAAMVEAGLPVPGSLLEPVKLDPDPDHQ